MAVAAVFLDVGETIVDESRGWLHVADRAGVPALTLLGVLGGLAARRANHKRVWEIVGRPPVALPPLEARDFYPDALPCLRALRDRGLLVGLAGNQPEAMVSELRACGVEVDVLASSEGWGVEKPSQEFFARIAAESRLPPEKIAYVGDRVDNDVEPALAAGMVAVHIRRGPWGHLQTPPAAALRIASLDELAGMLP
jgi:HAD superfamily hydrolase (TIGR01509 family)